MKTYYAKKNYAVVDGNYILVYSRYSQAFVDDCRQIEGRRWSDAEKANVFPMSSAPLVRALAVKWNIDLPKEIREVPQEEVQESLLGYINNVDIKGDEITVQFSYDPRIINSIRTIVPGIKWDASYKVWRTPRKNIKQVAMLASRFNLTVCNELEEEIQKFIDEADEMVKASSSLNARVEIPNIAIELLPYQQAGVAYLQKARKAILADQPGLGKTAQALATVASENRYPMVVVCPNTLKLNWERETKKFFPSLSVSVLNGTKSEKIEKSDVIIINYDILHERTPDIFEHGFYSLVVDEAHAIKNGEKKSFCIDCNKPVRSNARRCECGLTFKAPEERWTVKRTDAVMKLAKSLESDDFVFLLTGTPITNRPEELISQLEAIGRLDDFGGAWRFKSRYAPKKGMSTNATELNEKLRSMCFVRRMKSDVYGDLPPLRNAVQYLSISPEAMASYKKVEADVVEYFANRAQAIAEEEGSDGSKAYWEKRLRLERNQGLIRITGLRDAVSKIKYDNIISWLDNFIESSDTEKVIVFAEHIELVEKLYERYSGVAVKVRGGVSTDDRMAAVDSFQNDPKCRMFIGNMQATSEGLTLTAASDVVFCELGWTPAIHEQCVSRCYGRTNDMHGATAWYLLAPETIDEYVYGLLEKKKKIVDAVTNGEDSVQNTSIFGDLAVYLAERGMEQ